MNEGYSFKRVRRLWMESNYPELKTMICCKDLDRHLNYKCEQHDNPWDCPDYIVVRMQDGEIGIPVRDGGTSAIILKYCPWCGAELRK